MTKIMIEIVSKATEEVVETFEVRNGFPDSVEAGVNINLNHDEYYTRQVKKGEPNEDTGHPAAA